MKLYDWTNNLRAGVKLVEDFMAALEAVLITSLGRVAVLLAPLPSAVLVGRAMADLFELNGNWPWLMAGVIELVGLVTANLWTTAKEWNANKRKTDPAANEILALGLLCVYFGTTILLLLAIELPSLLETGDPRRLTALLFPALSAVSLLALNERVAHYRRVMDVEESKIMRTKSAQRGRTTGQRQGAQQGSTMTALPGQMNAQNNAQNGAFVGINRTRQARKTALVDQLLSAYRDNPELGATEAGRLLGVHRNTIYGYLDELERTGQIRRNGNKEIEVLK